MKRGLPKTPTAILRQRGSWRAVERAKTEPHYTPGVPECPAWVMGAARTAWNQLVPMLAAVGVLSIADGPPLARYCVLWARWAALVVENESTPEILKLSEHLLRLEVHFGMTPASRPDIRRIVDATTQPGADLFKVG
jgi:phage terminase small subunit